MRLIGVSATAEGGKRNGRKGVTADTELHKHSVTRMDAVV